MKKIIITGPESSGKTTLALALSNALGVAWVPEYARQFLMERGGKYHYDDLRRIAQGQLEMEQRFTSCNPEYLIMDTSFLVLKIWSEQKYRKADPYIHNRLALEKKSLYLLCKPDIPWEPDPLRENENSREELYDIYKEYLISNQCFFVEVEGTQKNRLNNSVEFIRQSTMD